MQKRLEKELIKLDQYNLSEDFVAISSEIDGDGSCFHTGLIISFEKKIHYFHYDGISVMLKDVTEDISSISPIYVKKLDIIYEEEVGAFLGHCQKLDKIGLKPNYGFVFNNSYYDPNNKKHFLVNAQHDITTCVGFCIKVIRGYLYNNDEYIKLEDWQNIKMANLHPRLKEHINKFLKKYADQNGISVESLYDKNELKRVSPSELLSSGFYDNLPIPKSSIDSIRPLLEQHIFELQRVA